MALQEALDQDQSQLGFSQPPDGGLFIPDHDSGLDQPEHRVLRVLQLGVLHELVDEISRTKVLSLGSSSLVAELDQTVTDVNAQMAEHTDAWELVVTKPPLVSAERESVLLDNYQVADSSQTRIILPKGAVTGSSLLRGHVSGSKYSPVIDLRIKTTSDKPLLGFSGPSEIVERESNGSWFRFKLPFVDVKLIEASPEPVEL